MFVAYICGTYLCPYVIMMGLIFRRSKDVFEGLCGPIVTLQHSRTYTNSPHTNSTTVYTRTGNVCLRVPFVENRDTRLHTISRTERKKNKRNLYFLIKFFFFLSILCGGGSHSDVSERKANTTHIFHLRH